MEENDAVIDAKNEAVNVSENKTQENTDKKPSPAQDLRDIQMLLISGIFPGNMAPSVVKAYQLLEQMAKAVEAQQESK
jgi:hypothetical protein